MSRIAQRLTDLLLAAFRIPAESIRCTSVEGQGLEGGAKIDDTVREEILSATVVIGLLSETSLASTYVLFEMGARWGAEKPFILLLTPGSTSDVMNGPLANLNALQCDSTELNKLIAQVSERLGKKHEEAHHYTRHIDSLCSSATRPTSPGAASEAGAFTFIRNGRLLVVGAHWDDLLLGCLGTMIKLRRICGYSVDLAVLCSNYPHGYFGRPQPHMDQSIKDIYRSIYEEEGFNNITGDVIGEESYYVLSDRTFHEKSQTVYTILQNIKTRARPHPYNLIFSPPFLFANPVKGKCRLLCLLYQESKQRGICCIVSFDASFRRSFDSSGVQANDASFDRTIERTNYRSGVRMLISYFTGVLLRR